MLTEQEGPGTPGVSSGLEWDAGIDWVTYIHRGRHAHAQLEAVAEEIRREFISPAEKETPFRLGSYVGCRIGALRLGRSGHSAVIQTSGLVAAKSWTKLVPCGGTPTRLDVQTTWRLSRSQPRYGQRFLRLAKGSQARPVSQRPRCGLSRATTGLFLGTVGDRTKSRYLRVYDKGVESNTAPVGVLWRTELEAKRGLAPALWADLQRASDVTQWCYDSVAEQWQRSGYGWPHKGSSRKGRGIAVPAREPTTEERLRLWLKRSVGPAVERLLTTHSPEQILQIMGIPTAPTNGQ